MMSHGDDAVQIGDFGLASSAASFLLDRNVTQLVGRSPEVILSAEKGSSTLPAPAYTMDLWSAGVVCFALYFARLPFTAVSDDEHGVVACLQSMCDLLGSPESSWPGVAKLRLWRRYGAHLRSVAAAEPRVAFSSPEFTKREAPNAVDLVASLLRWDPSQRAEAADAASALAAQVAGVSAALESAIEEAFAIEGEGAATGVSAVARDDDGLRKCGGGCNTKACSRLKVRRHRTGDNQLTYRLVPGHGHIYCSSCKCNVDDCPKLKKFGAKSDFCEKHAALLDAGTHYVVRGSLRESVPGKSLLQILASNSHWLSDPMMLPCDVKAFDDMFEMEWSVGGGCRVTGNRGSKYGMVGQVALGSR